MSTEADGETKGAFESLNRPLRGDPPLLPRADSTNVNPVSSSSSSSSSSQPARPHSRHATPVVATHGVGIGGVGSNGGGGRASGANGGGGGGKSTPSYGTMGTAESAPYASITKTPVNLDISKSARKRRKQNDRCQLLLNQRTAELPASPHAATAPPRTSDPHRQESVRAVHGNENNIRALVCAPPLVDVSDWLAIHTVDFYNDLSLLCGTVLDNCERNAIADAEAVAGGAETGGANGNGHAGGPGAAVAAANGGGGRKGGGGCHMMTAGPKYKYLWKDDKEFTTPMDLCAAQYVLVLVLVPVRAIIALVRMCAFACVRACVCAVRECACVCVRAVTAAREMKSLAAN